MGRVCLFLLFLLPLVICDELQALIAFYDSTQGSKGWTNDWDTSTTNYCDWYGVTCQGTSVTKLVLQSNGLRSKNGFVILELPNLTVLDLYDNRLKGTIPSELCTQTSLTYLDLGDNFFTTVPEELYECTGLTFLSLRHNEITGTLSKKIGSLTSLHYLQIGFNFFYGSIPYEITNLVSLTNFSASIREYKKGFQKLNNQRGNDFSGPIPDYLFTLPKLKLVQLMYNQFSGTIPNTLSNATSLEVLDLDYNMLEGTIPNIDNLKQLVILNVERNFLVGTVPSIQKLPLLLNASFSYNNLEGTIPKEFGQCPRLQELALGRNSMSGTLPPELADIPHLSRLFIGDNQFTGTVPESWVTKMTNATRINLSYNRLKGTVPSFHTLPLLEVLFVNRNLFHGDLPNFDGQSFWQLVAGLNSFSCPLQVKPKQGIYLTGKCVGFEQTYVVVYAIIMLVAGALLLMGVMYIYVRVQVLPRFAKEQPLDTSVDVSSSRHSVYGLGTTNDDRTAMLLKFWQALIFWTTFLGFFNYAPMVVNFMATLHCTKDVCPRFFYKSVFSIFMLGNLGEFSSPSHLHGVVLMLSLGTVWFFAHRWKATEKRGDGISTALVLGLPQGRAYRRELFKYFSTFGQVKYLRRWRIGEALLDQIEAIQKAKQAAPTLGFLFGILAPIGYGANKRYYEKQEAKFQEQLEQIRQQHNGQPSGKTTILTDCPDEDSDDEGTADRPTYESYTVVEFVSAEAVQRLVKNHPFGIQSISQLIRGMPATPPPVTFRNSFLEVHKCMAESDVIHESVVLPFRSRLLRSVLGQLALFVLLFAIMIASFAIRLVFTYNDFFEFLSEAAGTNEGEIFLQYLGAGIIFVSNVFVRLSVQMVTHYEGQLLHSAVHTRTVKKVVVLQLLNSILMVLKFDVAGLVSSFYTTNGTAATVYSYLLFNSYITMGTRIVVLIFKNKTARVDENGSRILLPFPLHIEYILAMRGFLASLVFSPACPLVLLNSLVTLLIHSSLIRLAVSHPRTAIYAPPSTITLRHVLGNVSVFQIGVFWSACMALLFFGYGPWVPEDEGPLGTRALSLMSMNLSRAQLIVFQTNAVRLTLPQCGLPPIPVIVQYCSPATVWALVCVLFILVRLNIFVVISFLMFACIPAVNEQITIVPLKAIGLPLSNDLWLVFVVPFFFVTSQSLSKLCVWDVVQAVVNRFSRRRKMVDDHEHTEKVALQEDTQAMYQL